MDVGRSKPVAFAALLATIALASCALLVDLDDLRDSQDASLVDVATDSPFAEASSGDAADAAHDGPSTSAYRAAVLADSPAAYWRFGESGGPIAVDEMDANDGIYVTGVGYGATGALTGDPNTAIKCLTSTSVSVATSTLDFAGMAPITIELWMNPTTIDSSYRYLVYKETQPPRNGYGVLITTTGGVDVAFERLAGNSPIDDIGIPIEAGMGFSYVVFSYDGSSVSSYLNGALTQTQTFKNSLVATSVPITIGGGQNSAGFVGVIDEVAIYDHALTATQIAAHFKIGKGL